MITRKVIKSSNLPTRLPVYQTLTTWVALDYFKAPQWLWGAVGLFYLVIWCLCFYMMGTEKNIDLLNNDKEKV